MPEIKISVKNRVARADTTPYVCGNTDYRLVFDFDEEWSEYDAKTARFAKESGYEDVVFIGNECPVPAISDTYYIYVGVYAGDLRTTTPARVACKKSILCGSGLPDPPAPDVYAQILDMLNQTIKDCQTIADRAEQFRDEADQRASDSEEAAKASATSAAASANAAESAAQSEKSTAELKQSAENAAQNAQESAEAARESAESAQKAVEDASRVSSEVLKKVNDLTEVVDQNKAATEKLVSDEATARKDADDALSESIANLEKKIGNLSNIMNFRGAVTSVDNITDPTEGDVVAVIGTGKEYVYSNGSWVELGDTSTERKDISNLQERMDTAEDDIQELKSGVADLTVSDTEALEMLAECGVITPACASDGALYTLNDKIVTI